MRSISRAAIAAILLSLIPLAPVQSAEDDLVVVDQDELNAWWRADERSARALMLTDGSRPERYGCIALPFIIDPDGRVSPGRQPLLARIGQAGGGQPSAEDLYTIALGELPRFQSTWGRPPSDAIYSSRSIVIGDARLRDRLGVAQWAAVHERLERECRIKGLATWVDRHGTETVVQPLPADPAQLLRSAPAN